MPADVPECDVRERATVSNADGRTPFVTPVLPAPQAISTEERKSPVSRCRPRTGSPGFCALQQGPNFHPRPAAVHLHDRRVALF
jgi:hypothetical protein